MEIIFEFQYAEFIDQNFMFLVIFEKHSLAAKKNSALLFFTKKKKQKKGW